MLKLSLLVLNSMLMLSVLSFDPVLMLPDCFLFFLFIWNWALKLPCSFIFENLNITIKTSTLDYNGERDLSSIINCVIFRL